MKRSTNLVIISGPSGAGKDSVIEGMVDQGIPIQRVITSTTRQIREGETHGREYYFVSEEEMTNMIRNDEMAEHARVFGRINGVTKKEVDRVRDLKDKIGIWRVDEQGAIALKNKYPDILTIAISAPPDELMSRVQKRGDTAESISQRMQSKKEWTGSSNTFEFTVQNKQNKLDNAVAEVISILEKEGMIDKTNENS
jgi:guanylate kinase